MIMNKIKILLLVLATALMQIGCLTPNKKEKPNVLFIIADDLRPELGCYNNQLIHSPNIDELASSGMLFEKTYCNVPVCGASRASLLTGLRPTRERFVDYGARVDEDAPNIVTLPKYFMQNGYKAISIGKVFHHLNDSPDSWSEEAFRVDNKPGLSWRNYITKENIDLAAENGGKGNSMEFPNVHDTAYYDGQTAKIAIDKLNELKKEGNPFFLAVGFLKPHLPFNAPEKYLKLYDSIDISIPDNYYRPNGAPDASMHKWYELRAYLDIPKEGILDTALATDLIRSYYACVSYTDNCIGQVMNELERLDLRKNTIVILIGDHGWNLGEHTLWAKHSQFNTSLHSPMIISVPDMKAGTTNTLSEFVDIYPTLCDLSGLEKPGHLQGNSLVPVLKDPNITIKEEAFSIYLNGESVITTDYIYSEYRDDSINLGSMLYDMTKDPAQNTNVVDDNEYIDIVVELKNKLEKARIEYNY